MGSKAGLALNLPGASSRRASGREAHSTRPKNPPARPISISSGSAHGPEHALALDNPLTWIRIRKRLVGGVQDEAASPLRRFPCIYKSIGRKIKGRVPLLLARDAGGGPGGGDASLFCLPSMMGLSWRFHRYPFSGVFLFGGRDGATRSGREPYNVGILMACFTSAGFVRSGSFDGGSKTVRLRAGSPIESGLSWHVSRSGCVLLDL